MFILEKTAYIEKPLALSNDKIFPENGWLVNHEGHKVDSNYKGRKYTIIDKENLTLSWGQRLHQFLGLVLVVCSLGAAYLITSFRKHFEKTTCHFYLKKVEDLTVSFELPANTEPLPNIPNEIFRHILYLTDPAALITSAPQVSKAWYNATNDITLWKKRCSQPESILGLKCWQDYFKNLDFDLSDLDDDTQKLCRDVFERIRQEPFLKSPELPIPLFAYQYLETKKDLFDLVLSPSIKISDLIFFRAAKEYYMSFMDIARTHHLKQFFKFWKSEKPNEPCWILISKKPLAESFKKVHFEQHDLLAKTYHPGLPFSLPTFNTLTFYEALTYRTTKEAVFGTYAYYDNDGTCKIVNLKSLIDVDSPPRGSHATLVL